MNRQSSIDFCLILFLEMMLFFLIIGCSGNSKKSNFFNDFIENNTIQSGNEATAISHYRLVVKKALRTQNNDLITWSYISLSESYLNEFLLDDSKSALKKAEPYIDFSINSKNLIKYHMIYGDILHLSAQYDSSIIHYKKVQTISRKLNIKDKILFKMYIRMGFHFQVMDEFDKSLKNTYKALKVAEDIKDSTLILEAKVEIGLSHYYLNDPKKTISQLNECLSNYQNYMDNETRARIHSLLGLSYSGLSQFNNAKFHLLQALSIYTEFNKNGIGESWNNLAILDMDQEKWSEAIPKLKKVMDIIKDEKQVDEEDRDSHLSAVSYNISRCYLNTNQLDSSQFYCDFVMKHAKKTGSKLGLSDASMLNSKLAEKRRDWQSANEWLKKHHELKNEVFNLEKTSAINELSVKYEMQKKEQSVLIAKKENKIQSTRFQFTLVLGILISILLLVILISIYFKNLKDKEIKSKEHQLLASKLQIAESDLKLKETELLNLTNLIIDKNRTQQAIINEDEEINVHAQKSLDNIKILTNEDWDKFNSKFSEVHPNFIAKLRVQKLNFSASDKRYLMLLKLGLDNYEISNALGISTSSVRTHRYRLNKKIDGHFSIDDLVKL